MFGLNRRTFGIEVIAAGVPLALVYAGQFLVSSAPPASVTVQTTAPVITPVSAQSADKLSPEQQKADDWIRTLPRGGVLTSPLNHPIRESEVPKPVTPTQPVPVDLPANPIEGLKLGAVLGNADDQLALINSKVFHLGDTVRPGLKLTEIDPRHSRITLTDAAGNTYEIKREQK